MTASDVHRKIQEISSKYITGRPPITVSSLSVELDIPEDHLSGLLKQLKALGLIQVQENTIRITDSGIKATLPE